MGERDNVSQVRSLDWAWFRALLGQGQMHSHSVTGKRVYPHADSEGSVPVPVWASSLCR